MKKLLILLLLTSLLPASVLGALTGAVRINTDTTGTNTRSSSITVTANTNLNVGSLVVSNVAASSVVLGVNASKQVVAASTTGIGSVVLDTLPTISSPTISDPIINNTFFFAGLIWTIEGVTPDAFETTITFIEPTSDANITIDHANIRLGSLIATNSVEIGNPTDTTLTRNAAGFASIEGKPVASPASATTGDVMYFNGTQWVRLAIGTAAQVLKVNGAATAPEWGAAGSGTPGGSDTQVQFNNAGAFGGANVTITALTNLNAGTVTGTNTVYAGSFVGIGTTADSRVDVPDDDASHYAGFQANNTTTTSVNMIMPAAPFSGLALYSVNSSTNWVIAQATAGTDYTTSSSTEVFTNKGYDASATGNNLVFTDYKEFVAPFRVDSAGCTIVTNSYTDNTWGLATYSGSADTNGNYALFRIGKVPYDLNSTNDLTLRGLAIRTAGTSTTSPTFSIAYYQPAASAASMPTDFTACSGFVVSTAVTISSAAANDIFYFDDITLTGWASALTAGRDFILAIARGDNGNNDALTVTAGSIQFTRIK